MWGRWGGLRCLQVHVGCSHCVVEEQRENHRSWNQSRCQWEKQSAACTLMATSFSAQLGLLKWAKWWLKMQREHCVQSYVSPVWQVDRKEDWREANSRLTLRVQSREVEVGGPTHSPSTLLYWVQIQRSLSAFTWSRVPWMTCPSNSFRLYDSAAHDSRAAPKFSCSAGRWRCGGAGGFCSVPPGGEECLDSWWLLILADLHKAPGCGW